MIAITPFEINVAEQDLEHLRQRLLETRWPGQICETPWRDGTDLAYLKELVEYWGNKFNWSETERELNRFDHFLANIDGLKTHFIHQRSPHADAIPLLITHGWPGSIIEFMSMIRRLTHPDEFGGEPSDAFHVICPSLPGFAWSDPPVAAGMNARSIAGRHAALMSELGYDRYLAQGGDWGAVITQQLALVDPEHCQGIHLNMVPLRPTPDMLANVAALSESEQRALARTNEFQTTGMAYYQIQSTQPQTLAYALQDSPVGLAAWMVDKFRAWSDCKGELEQVIDRDRLLSNISLYWFTGSAASSLQIYREEALSPSPGDRVDLPTGVAVFPKEIALVPRSWAETRYNVIHWTEQPRGGHFAAMEQPELFARDLFSFQAKLND